MSSSPSDELGEAGPRSSVSGVVQIAYLVDDVREGALRHSAAFGSGPFFIGDHIPLSEVIHAGEPAVFDHSSAYGQWGDVMVELVCIHQATPGALALAVGVGHTGIHHVARFVDDIDAEAAYLDATGHPQVLLASTASGQRFAFHAGGDLAHLLEIYQPSDGLRGFYGRVAEASKGWDGSDPIRAMSAAAPRPPG